MGDAGSAAELVAGLRRGFATGRSLELDWRQAQLTGLRRLLTEQADALTEAVRADVGKPTTEVRAFELQLLVNEIDHMLANLAGWLVPRRVGVPLNAQPASAEVHPQPKGVVLVLSPWNYPLLLLFSPAIGALAAGNAVLLKPSELAPRTAALVAELVPGHLDPELVAVRTGGVAEATDLLRERFDHILFTGSAEVGKVVLRAAAEQLTPVTLELGGKSPAFVDEHTDLRVAARRIAWAKFTNAGQTCVSPDHVLVTPGAREELVRELAAAIESFYGTDPRRSADYGRLVDDRHFQRVEAFLGDGRVVIGGASDADARYLAPTVLVDVDIDAPVMTEEIFGPVLPVLEVPDAEAALDFIAARPHPLALYLFSGDPDTREAFQRRSHSGALVLDAAMLHLAVPGLPFGGIGDSGMGNYHGRASIDTFSHQRSVLSKPTRPDTLELVYPPVTGWRRALMKLTRLTR
ncbi:aldehyde dehydrogenase family protein [Enemella evansiae]|uniref:aldehyde dehydrogenase family protein n=1 Tax=Enemella evansiae TaxID=2016499 RepID=UPI000B95D13B|nr:aldehyde dehydrogenase family protein [Enemella evansiae]OYO05390.1 aldehyde dehydrogenase family protein [Enemella evansiae]